MKPRFRLLLPAFLLAALPASARQDLAIQRYLASLELGDTLEIVKRVYPPIHEWSVEKLPQEEFSRVVIERGQAKGLPGQMDRLTLDLRRGRLVYMRLVYDADASREKPLGEVVVDLSLMYGEPHRSGVSYWWGDSKTVIRASNEELVQGEAEARKVRPKSVELRTSIELMERKIFQTKR
ncbi:MAG: hypothetical protein AAB578_05340 [Elusimicrobiota bacterium]